MENLTISLLGKEYQVACSKAEKPGLLAAVSYLDERLQEAESKTHATGERLAIMTALNLAHEFLQFQRGNGFDLPATKRRIGLMEARLDGVLSQQEKLF
ncbi:cell division protein ZapA [Betaproteobacteria bacterium]|nr:cell division protein ZapA [Betaproteobacteria bacterium]GHT96216.1 cell division protein ZapA [Betaproteobacteria bacterium]GHU04834.1 cell division protein ZapA [Betaproteobacteria bacterium]GHU10220.1 cell division protein ZapA [Betaproteobacteria bacterium]GHU16991.1 cell division protein ZapA [Betaproteobacteria bacterium]